MRQILSAIGSVLVKGIMDWKMPLFRGLLYAITPAIAAVYSGLQDYKSFDDLDGLTWVKLALSASTAAAIALAGYLDSSFTRTKDTLNARDGAAAPTPTP